MTMPSSRLPTLLMLSLLAAPLVASAGPKEDAKRHMDRAMKAHEAGRFNVALHELEEAYAADPQPELLFAIAQLHVKLDHCADAITFYEKFLATHPGPEDTADTKQAIATCKAKTPAAVTTEPTPTPTPTPEPTPTPAPAPAPAPAPPAAPSPFVDQPRQGSSSSARAPWYTDKVGDALVIGGVVATTIGLVMYSSARSDISDAGSAPTYQEYRDLVDSGHSKRTYSIILVGGGLGLAGAGVLHYVLHDRRTETHGVGMVPATGGAVVTWMGSF